MQAVLSRYLPCVPERREHKDARGRGVGGRERAWGSRDVGCVGGSILEDGQGRSLGDREGQGSLACCGPAKSRT